MAESVMPKSWHDFSDNITRENKTLEHRGGSQNQLDALNVGFNHVMDLDE